MSTAIMSQNAMYEFGDNLIKNGLPTTDTQSVTAAHLSVNSTGAAVRLTLSRMASVPAGGAASPINLLLCSATSPPNTIITADWNELSPPPAPPSTAPSAALTATTTVNTSRYKTELCRPFEEFGVCKYGDKCQFAHGMNELRSLARHPKYKTELCRTYHTVGFCPYGPRCHFVHNQDEVVVQKNTSVPPGMLTRTTSATSRPRPAALSPSLSLDSPSPPCSLSQSPTSSMGSFFSSEPELHSPGIEDQRLPVFNRLIDTAQFLSLSDLML